MEKNDLQRGLFELNKRLRLTIFYYILLNLLIPILSFEKVRGIIVSKYSFIILKIKNSGKIYLFDKDRMVGYFEFGRSCSCPGHPLPNEIHINGISQDEIKTSYNLTQTENEVKLIWYTKLRHTACLFSHCSKINEIDLSNFDSSEITTVSGMFRDCTSLTSVNFNNFDVSKVKDMSYMFYKCYRLNNIDLSKFDTSQVTRMDCMFRDCNVLSYLNLSNFYTPKVEDMSNMFYECRGLKYLDLLNFDTSLVTDMHNMFYRCYDLKSLDLSSFNTSKVTNMDSMFNIKYYLEYLNLEKATINSATTDCIFCNIISEIAVCSQHEEWKNYFTYNKIINCVDYSNNYEIKCYKNEKTITNNYCKYCGTDYYKIYNNEYDEDSYINCYKSLEGYYFDQEESLYKPCYLSCKSCDTFGSGENHNCL